VIDVEDSFEGDIFKEVVINDMQAATHNTYFIYSSYPAGLPDGLLYRITNFTKISEPCSIRIFIDKRIALKAGATDFTRKIYTALVIGNVQTDIFNVYGSSRDVLGADIIKGEEIKNNYPAVFDNLKMGMKDEFIVLQRYFFDPMRGC
jgi:hypothetical protein